jgi:hypothetical protein
MGNPAGEKKKKREKRRKKLEKRLIIKDATPAGNSPPLSVANAP